MEEPDTAPAVSASQHPSVHTRVLRTRESHRWALILIL